MKEERDRKWKETWTIKKEGENVSGGRMVTREDRKNRAGEDREKG